MQRYYDITIHVQILAESEDEAVNFLWKQLNLLNLRDDIQVTDVEELGESK